MIRFMRAHGLGNDYLVTDLSSSLVVLTPNTIRLLCHRHLGIGGDGILLQTPSIRADFGVRIFNPDGSEAEKSGNGLRIFTRYLHYTGQLRTSGSIETLGGLVHAEVHTLPGGLEISVDMGRATFATQEIPLRMPLAEAIEVDLPLPGYQLRGTALSVGNPHFVMFVGDPSAIPLSEVGPRIETHPWFPHRTNVQFARVRARDRVEVRIWERGAGETMASGSSACAVAAAGLRTGRLDSEVTVEMEGGSLQVQIDPHGQIRQRGPVTIIATGEVSEELELQALALSSQP